MCDTLSKEGFEKNKRSITPGVTKVSQTSPACWYTMLSQNLGGWGRKIWNQRQHRDSVKEQEKHGISIHYGMQQQHHTQQHNISYVFMHSYVLTYMYTHGCMHICPMLLQMRWPPENWTRNTLCHHRGRLASENNYGMLMIMESVKGMPVPKEDFLLGVIRRLRDDWQGLLSCHSVLLSNILFTDSKQAQCSSP